MTRQANAPFAPAGEWCSPTEALRCHLSVGVKPHAAEDILNRELPRSLRLRRRAHAGPLADLVAPSALRSPRVKFVVGANLVVWPGHGLVPGDRVSFHVGPNGNAPPEVPLGCPCGVLNVMDGDRFILALPYKHSHLVRRHLAIVWVDDPVTFSATGENVWILPAKEQPPPQSRWVQVIPDTNEILWPNHGLKIGDEVFFTVERPFGMAPPELPTGPCWVRSVVDPNRFTVTDHTFSSACKNVWVMPTKENSPEVLDDSAYIATHLRLAVRTDSRGNWGAGILPTQPVNWKYAWRVYDFELETARVLDLRQRGEPPKRRGRAYMDKWPDELRQAYRNLSPNRRQELGKLADLRAWAVEFVTDLIGHEPGDNRRIYAVVAELYDGANN